MDDHAQCSQHMTSQEPALPPVTTFTPRRRADVLMERIGQEILVLDRSENLVHQLNPTASLIWELCDGTHSLTDIAQQLTDTFAIDFLTALHDVTTLLQQLHTLALLDAPADMLVTPPIALEKKECPHPNP
jgi:Coenzyme PQQ synthesis protein D (PqqD)